MRVQNEGIHDWQSVLARLSKQPHVLAAAPAIYEQVLVSRGPRARGAVLKGMIPFYERKVSDLLSSVKQGSAEALDGPAQSQSDNRLNASPNSPTSLEGVRERVAGMPPIILGNDMADALGATVGSMVMVTSPQ